MTVAAADRLTLAQAARMMRDATKDKSYRALPLGEEVGRYMRGRRKSLTPDSARDYESCLHKLALYFADLNLKDLEPPLGRERMEEFLDHQWGAKAGRTYNKALSVMHSFFKWQVMAGRMYGDPTIGIERAKKAGIYRTTFTPEQVAAILAGQAELRDRIALRLLLHYGLRRGALARVQFKHFDHVRKKLTIFTKGQKVQIIPIPQPGFWDDLGRLLLDLNWDGAELRENPAAMPEHYLMARRKKVGAGKPGFPSGYWKFCPDMPMGHHGLHSWWYECLARAGIVSHGTTAGERMHKARHSAGQNVLDKTGNLKAVQKLLGHSSIQTTADIYTDWDMDRLEATLLDVIEDV